jgi:hypothetical protein
VDPGLKKLQQELASAITGLSPQERTWHPEGKWCAAEVLEHLYLTYSGTIKGFERMAEAGKPAMTPPSLRQRIAKVLVLSLGYMPGGREAPKMARPRGLPTEKILAEIESKIAEMDECISRQEEKFGKSAPLLDHFILGPLTAAQWRKFHLVHGRHHVQQIRRLRESADKTEIKTPA